jgi:hypothetical protein
VEPGDRVDGGDVAGQSDEDARAWHRRFAVDANNRAWALSEREGHSTEDERELMCAAYAAAHHWSKIGTAEERAHADLLLGRVHALLGHGELAMRCARAAFDAIGSRQSAPWKLAFAHAVLADAARASGDRQLHALHYAEANALGSGLADPDDRQIFLATFSRIPAPQSGADEG